VSRLRQLGPGILLAATTVGAGDLLTASLAGSEAGLVVLWAVPGGVILKWTLSEGLARWQMATGETLLEGWVLRLGRWIQWFFLVYLLLFSMVTGGALVTACGVAGTGFYQIGDPNTSKIVWGVIHSLAGLALVRLGSFRLFEILMSGCVAIMSASVVLTAVLLRPDWGAIARGIVPSIPASGPAWLLAVLGGIGGTMTLLSYSYWIREEGRSGRQGLKACRIDLALSYVMTGLFGMSVVIIGSRIHLRGEGVDLALVLADQLAGALGPIGKWIFLAGFWGTVFSSVLGCWQSLPHLFVDFLGLARGRRVADPRSTRAYQIYLLGIATLPLLLLWTTPVRQIQLVFGILGALFLPLLCFTLLLMNNRPAWVGREFRNGLVSNAILTAALLFFAYLGFR